jgi:hypothetical protein
MRSLLANMEATFSAIKLVNFILVLDVVIFIAAVTKQVSPQTVHRCFQKARVSINDLND